MKNNLLLRLDVVKDVVKSGGLFTEVSDDDNGAADSLLEGAVSVDLGKTNPLAESLSIISHDEGDVALSAESLDKASVLVVVASLGENAKLGSTSV